MQNDFRPDQCGSEPADPGESGRRMAAARADFLARGEAAQGVPATVAASWLRSRSAGVDADRYSVPFHSDIDVDSRLARCARPVLAHLENDLCEVPVTIALTDAHARIIDRRDCSAAVGRVLDGVDFNPGYCFGEGGVGTNGIGTVFEAGQPVSVVGSAHFTESLVPFACTGAPVLDPVSGRVEGVLDVSLLARDWNPLIQVLVRTAAGEIGRNLLRDRSHTQQALFAAYVRAEAKSRHAVMAVGDTVILNQQAQRLLSGPEQVVLQQHARHLADQESPTSQTLTLDNGRSLSVRAHRVQSAGTVYGVILVIVETEPGDRGRHDPDTMPRLTVVGAPRPGGAAPGTPAAVTRPADPGPMVTGSGCPAWRAAGVAIHAAFTAGAGVVVAGESGSGRSTLGTRVFAHRYPRGQVIEAASMHQPGWAEAPGSPLLVVLRDLDTCGEPELRHAERVVAEAATRAGCFVLVTLTRADQRMDPVLAHFQHSVAVPALRHRGVDLPRLTTQLLRELAPQRTVAVSPAASRVLAAYSWPENIPQLREALAHALAHRPAGDLLPEDLPGFCRTSRSRRLTTIEVAERDAIIAALSECGGNRVHAAAALGISRSSLYRKLRQFGITEV
ncbi:MAG: sigma-54-dependent Fis family transcriptional regulator [Actinomycetales bacterium]